MKTNYDLTPFESRILSALLDNSGGNLTKTIARQVGYTGRKEIALMRQRMLRLQDRGFVTTLDGIKPACWVITDKGKSAVRGAEVRPCL